MGWCPCPPTCYIALDEWVDGTTTIPEGLYSVHSNGQVFGAGAELDTAGKAAFEDLLATGTVGVDFDEVDCASAGSVDIPETPVGTACQRREVLSDGTQTVVAFDGSATVWAPDGTSTAEADYDTWLAGSGLTVAQTLNCFDGLCLQVGNAQWVDDNGDNTFETVNGGTPAVQTRAALDTAGAVACTEIVCQQVYGPTDFPIDAGLPDGTPDCPDITATWFDGTDLFTWDVATQSWLAAPPIAPAEGCSDMTTSLSADTTVSLTPAGIEIPLFGQTLEDNGSPFVAVTPTQLQATATGTFMLCYTVMWNETYTGRTSPTARILINGVPASGLASDSYIRGASGDHNGVNHGCWPVNVTAGDLITLEAVRDTSGNPGSSQILQADSAFTASQIGCGTGDPAPSYMCFGPSGSGTVADPFTDLASAWAAGPGVYDFDISGQTFTAEVSANGWVTAVVSYGQVAGTLPTTTTLDGSTRGLLPPAVLAVLTDTAEVRMVHSGGDLDATTTDPGIIAKLVASQSFHRGTADNTINDNWVGINGAAMAADAVCTSTYAAGLANVVVHACGTTVPPGWIPQAGFHRPISWTGGEITATETMKVMARADVGDVNSIFKIDPATGDYVNQDNPADVRTLTDLTAAGASTCDLCDCPPSAETAGAFSRSYVGTASGTVPANQVFAVVDEAEPLIINELDAPNPFFHVENNTEIVADVSMTMSVLWQPQTQRVGTASSGANTIRAFAQENRGGAGWVTIGNSAVDRSASSPGNTGVSPVNVVAHNLMPGDRVRGMGMVDDLDLVLEYDAASVDGNGLVVPAMPTCIATIEALLP